MPDDQTSNENTYILDTTGGVEMARLMKQDRLLTAGMGGLFPERDDVATMHDILDIACGPGGWVLDTAFAYAKCKVVGIDLDRTMVEYARAQAWSQGLENASFKVMNALERLDFPDASFDLVNARFLVGFMLRKSWPTFLQECMRITKPGGIIRLTEFDEPGTSNSAAFETLKDYAFQAISKAGFCFDPQGRDYGILSALGRLLREAGCQETGYRAHVIDFSYGTEGHEPMYQNCKIGFQLVQPFMVKMKILTEEAVQQAYDQMLIGIMSEDFSAIWSYMTAWGRKPA
jgi:SAM-dependent methyltransferase